MTFVKPLLLGVAALCVGLPALAKDRPWTTGVADFFRAEPAPAPVVRTTAVAAFPDVVPERAALRPDPAQDLLAENPYEGALAAAKARENLFGSTLDREDPYAEQLALANPYTEDLHLVNPYVNRERFGRPIAARSVREPAGLENPYTAARAERAPGRAPGVDLSNPYSAR